MSRKILFQQVHDCMPIGVSVAYHIYSKTPDSVPWLSHIAPDGEKTFALWVDPDAMTRWAACRGKQMGQKLELLKRAVEKYGVEVDVASVMGGQS